MSGSDKSGGIPDFLRTGGGMAAVESHLEDERRRLIGSVVRGYRIAALIGEGGMASVYRAERADGEYRKQVAVKFIKPAVLDSAAAEQFLAERQILAHLEHPNIARLIDGGFTDQGRPFMVMELVEGTPIDEFCAKRQLPIPQLIALFRQVLDAVRHAHNRLVVHRDLKPLNVLVTDRGRVKLLDFGIAKLLEQSTGRTQALLTPRFAAPEQVAGGEITVGTDVYQLGIMLYLLLTRAHPYQPHLETPSALIQAITESTPPLPSRSVTPGMAAKRRLRKRLKGDLDAIVMKCLRARPGERYQSVGELASDLDHYLGGRPVGARYGGFGYRLSRFARRHRTAVSVAALSAAVLAAVSTLYVIRLGQERDRALAQSARATAVAGFLGDLLASTNPLDYGGTEPKISDFVETAARDFFDRLNDQPAIQTELLYTLSRALIDSGRYQAALEVLEKPLARERSREGSPLLPLLLRNYGYAQYRNGAFDAARTTMNQAEAASEQASPLWARIQQDRALLERRLGNHDQALARLERALPVYRSDRVDALERAKFFSNYGLVLQFRDDFEGAIDAYRTAIALFSELKGPDHPRVAITLGNLAGALNEMGRREEALSTALRTVEILKSVGMVEAAASAGITVSAIYRESDRPQQALEQALADLELIESVHGPDFHMIVYHLRIIADTLSDLGRCAEAAAYRARMSALLDKHFGASSNENWRQPFGGCRRGAAEELGDSSA